MAQSMEWWEWLKFGIDVAAGLFTVAASGIAVWLFLFKREEIGSFLRVIKNFVHQNSVAEMRTKLEQISALHASDVSNATEISSLFLDICGQIDGSPFLKLRLSDISTRMRQANSGKRPIQEPHKRALVSELRESLRHLDVESFVESMEDHGK